MITPNVRLYARFVLNPATKTPKYTSTAAAGYYQPFEAIRGKDGKVSLFLLESNGSGSKDTAPAMRLQAKGSLNLTGMKDYFIDGKLSGFAYGYPYDRPTYGKDKKVNPFYAYKNDGFLFIVKQKKGDMLDILPDSIEMLVLENARPLIAAYCKQLVMGGFEDVLNLLRLQSQQDKFI